MQQGRRFTQSCVLNSVCTLEIALHLNLVYTCHYQAVENSGSFIWTESDFFLIYSRPICKHYDICSSARFTGFMYWLLWFPGVWGQVRMKAQSGSFFLNILEYLSLKSCLYFTDDVPPYFKTEPVRSQLHLERNRLVLTCMAEGSWPLEFKWIHNNTELTRFSLEYR